MLPDIEKIVSEKNQAMADELKHQKMPIELINLYHLALFELKNENNQSAMIVWQAIYDVKCERGYIDPEISRRGWAYNIHYNTWGESSFAGIIKARVVKLRLEKKDER